jgi:hypothetical protein
MSAAATPPARRLASRVNPNAALAVVAVAQFMVVLDGRGKSVKSYLGVTNVPLPFTVWTSPSARSTPTALRTVWSATP